MRDVVQISVCTTGVQFSSTGNLRSCELVEVVCVSLHIHSHLETEGSADAGPSTRGTDSLDASGGLMVAPHCSHPAPRNGAGVALLFWA